MDGHDIIDDIYMRATELMQQSGVRMDENCVGKLQDFYLWCWTLKTQTTGCSMCPLCFTRGCRGGVCITEQHNFLTLEFRGNNYPRCHDRQIMNPGKSDPSLCGFKTYLSSCGDCGDIESGLPVPKFFCNAFNN